MTKVTGVGVGSDELMVEVGPNEKRQLVSILSWIQLILSSERIA